MTLPVPDRASSPLPRRVWAFALRHYYLYRGSWPRLVEMFYWPVINLTLFGFISLSMINRPGQQGGLTQAFLGGLLLSEILTRTVLAILIMYMEEMHSRNMGHLFASPIRLRDFLVSSLGLGTLRCLITVTPAFILVRYVFGFSILSLGGMLPIYTILLFLLGCWYGVLIMCIFMRYGLAAEWLGWMGSFVLMPFFAPYYPVAVLPHVMQNIAWALPGAYIFESMRIQIATGTANLPYLWAALGLNLVYLALSLVLFRGAFRAARQSGGLLQMGE